MTDLSAEFEKWYNASGLINYIDYAREPDRIKATFLAGAETVLNIIRDMAIVSWTYTEADKDDAKTMIHKLICQEIAVALDPAVSKDAQALIDLGAKQEREKCAEIAESWSGQWFAGDKAKEIARTIKGESQ